jgi:hypothetical protein
MISARFLRAFSASLTRALDALHGRYMTIAPRVRGGSVHFAVCRARRVPCRKCRERSPPRTAVETGIPWFSL